MRLLCSFVVVAARYNLDDRCVYCVHCVAALLVQVRYRVTCILLNTGNSGQEIQGLRHMLPYDIRLFGQRGVYLDPSEIACKTYDS